MTSANLGESRDFFSDAQIQQGLKLCKDTTRDHVLQMLSQGIDMTLQKLEAKRAEVRAEEAAEIKRGILEIEEKRYQVAERYQNNFESWFDTGRFPLSKELATSPTGLSLLDTEVLEQQIIVERMVANAATETQAQHAHLNRRFCFLKNERIKPTDSPIGPTGQGRLLVDALEEFDLSPGVHNQGLRVMEQHFSDSLCALYSKLNQQLIEMGFLPEIKHHIWRTADELRGGRGQSSAGLTESQRRVIDERRRAASADDVGSMLRELLGVQVAGEQQGEEKNLGQSFIDEGDSLLGMLDAIDPEDETGSLLDQLDSKAEEMSEDKPAGVTREVLELVEKLSQEFQKPFLRNASSSQALLVKKIVKPLGKLAVIEPAFLADNTHPVRGALKHLRAFAEILEIRDPQSRSSYLLQFEHLLQEFEFLAAQTPEQQKTYVQRVEGVVKIIKSSMQQNIGRLHQSYMALENYQKRRDALIKLLYEGSDMQALPDSAQSFLCKDWVDMLQHLSVGQNLDLPDESLSDLIDLAVQALQGDQASCALVIQQLESMALVDAIYRFQACLDQIDKSVEPDSLCQVASRLMEAPPEDQRAAQKSWLGNPIKPGMWLKVNEEGGTQVSLCRLYRIYESGRRCVFVDGLGLKALELTAVDVKRNLQQGVIQVCA